MGSSVKERLRPELSQLDQDAGGASDSREGQEKPY
jgi:hypothetical protein